MIFEPGNRELPLQLPWGEDTSQFDAEAGLAGERQDQYFDLMAKVSPMVNWNELRLVGGKVGGGLFR